MPSYSDLRRFDIDQAVMVRARHRTVDCNRGHPRSGRKQPPRAHTDRSGGPAAGTGVLYSKARQGLTAVGYLDEEDQHRFVLGPVPYVLSLRSRRLPIRDIRHDDLVALSQTV